MKKQEPQFLVNSKGEKTAVVLTIREYERLEVVAHALEARRKELKELDKLVEEVHKLKQSGKAGIPIQQLLNEL